MSLRINNNNLGSWANIQLQKSHQSLASVLEKLSSGKRINRAADDASGMHIADMLGSQARGLGQAIRNASDAVSMAQIADGALQESSNLIQNIRTKALQAAQDGQTTESRNAIQADIDKALSSLNQIAQTTSFNGQKLLSGNFTDKSFQVGAYPGETVTASFDSAETAKLGDSEVGQLSDINVMTQEGAQKAIQIADEALSQLNQNRSNIGSLQNQLEATIGNLATTRINVLSAQSAIQDVDVAEESMVLS
ncbi:MAG: flagellin, partial [Desulfobulbaceae bacterium]|nr:flagellin [Desulfobulbaceae bacterium]